MMKRLVIVTCLLAIGSSAWSLKKGPGINHNCIYVISMAENMFYFKSHSQMVGADVEVYDSKTGKKVSSQVVTRRRTIVNLNFHEPGDYIILITKGDFRRRYVYHKTTLPSSA